MIRLIEREAELEVAHGAQAGHQTMMSTKVSANTGPQSSPASSAGHKRSQRAQHGYTALYGQHGLPGEVHVGGDQERKARSISWPRA